MPTAGMSVGSGRDENSDGRQIADTNNIPTSAWIIETGSGSIATVCGNAA